MRAVVNRELSPLIFAVTLKIYVINIHFATIKCKNTDEQVQKTKVSYQMNNEQQTINTELELFGIIDTVLAAVYPRPERKQLKVSGNQKNL